MSSDPFSKHIEAVAKALWGDPNQRLSTKTQLRYGAQGSRSVDLEKGVWHDHEAGEGGGVLDMVTRETGQKNGAAVTYLREELGLDIPDDRPLRPVQQAHAQRHQVAAYDYQDENGDLLFQVIRFEPKDFRRRRPDPSAPEGWAWSIKGVRQVPYRLPEVIEAMAMDQVIFLVEGEKDADALWKLGAPATCNAGGAGKWPEGLSEALKGADIVILPDNDDAGRNHAAVVGAALQGHARTVRTLALEGVPLKGDVYDWIRAGGDITALHVQVETKARPWCRGAPESRFGAVVWASLDSVKLRHDWLVDGMMFTGDFGLTYGASQSGKSFLSVDMGLSIARGERFLGKDTRQGSVIYQAGEGGKGLIPRLKAYRAHHELGGEDVPFVLLPGRVDLFAGDDENGVEPFIAELQAWQAWLTDPLALVVIDTWSTATPGANENASEDVSRALRAIQRIQDATRAGVLVVHHKNAGGEKPRGHTSLYANADTALEVIRDEENPDQRTLRVAKVKDGEDGEKIGFKLQSLEIGTYDSGKPMTSCVVVPAEVGSQGTGKSRRYLANGQMIFLKCLDDAILHRGGVIPPLDGAPYGMRGVMWQDFLPIYRAVRSVTHDDNAIRQALHRDGDALSAKGLIGKATPYVWVTDRGREYLR